MSIKYELVMFWSEEDLAFTVDVPELPGCMADGATYEQAVANARQVIGEWIETARELGRPIPAPRTFYPRRSSAANCLSPGTRA
jgi:predicted RNase H-like HicB family nuclease